MVMGVRHMDLVTNAIGPANPTDRGC